VARVLQPAPVLVAPAGPVDFPSDLI
jgi:hypothetical protein